METLLQDLRYGLRNLRRTRGLATVAIVTLALGIGANTAIFSVINAVLLRPLPFREPGQLVRLYETEAAPGNYPFTGPDFLDWKTQNKSFQDMTLYSWGQDMNLSDNGNAERVIGVSTEWNFFPLLGARALLGRTWVQGDDVKDNNIVILSYALWQTHFGGDPNIGSKTIELNAKKFSVVGVMPPSFRFPSEAQLWYPQPMDLKTLGPRGNHNWRVIGRLKPGVPLKQAQAEMTVIAAQLEKQYPESNHKVGASLVALHEDQVGSARDSLIMMLWAVALVLLIACANVANLLLSRSVARQREMAIRSALGAARSRLVRQLLTESVLLGATGGAAGLAVAWASVRVLAKAKHMGIPAINPIELNLPVMAFTFAVAVLSGVVFGILPALQTARPGLHDELKGGAGSAVTASRGRRFASNLLVVAEMGLSLLLLIAAGLLLKDFAALRNANVGVRPDGVWTAALRLPDTAYPDAARQHAFAASLLGRLQQIPGVDSAALSTRLPTQGGSNYYAKIRGKVMESMGGPLVEVHAVTPDYFRTFGIPLIAGREFTQQDVQRTFEVDQREEVLFKDQSAKVPPEVTDAIVSPSVINQAMAKAFWPNENPIGKLYAHGSDHGPWHEVVGVVGDVKQWGLVHAAVPEGYDALADDSRLLIVLHTTVPPAAVSDAVRNAVKETDSTLPLFQVRTMDQVIADQAAGQQFVTSLVGIFAGLALVLAAVGIYGVLSYLVTQRTREIGIRMSLGARRGDVLRLVLSHGARLAVIGCAVGLVGAVIARRVIASALEMVKGTDVRIFAVATVSLIAVALIACYIPARRATHVDPMVALRDE